MRDNLRITYVKGKLHLTVKQEQKTLFETITIRVQTYNTGQIFNSTPLKQKSREFKLRQAKGKELADGVRRTRVSNVNRPPMFAN